jgi:hypothetical protein
MKIKLKRGKQKRCNFIIQIIINLHLFYNYFYLFSTYLLKFSVSIIFTYFPYLSHLFPLSTYIVWKRVHGKALTKGKQTAHRIMALPIVMCQANEHYRQWNCGTWSSNLNAKLISLWSIQKAYVALNMHCSNGLFDQMWSSCKPYIFVFLLKLKFHFIDNHKLK